MVKRKRTSGHQKTLAELNAGAIKYLESYLRHDGESQNLRRALIRRIHRALAEGVPADECWVLLGDLNRRRKPAMRCMHNALKSNPRNSEAHLELMASYFFYLGRSRTAYKHAQEALRYCKGHSAEEAILFSVAMEAKQAGFDDIARSALLQGKKRFPRKEWE